MSTVLAVSYYEETLVTFAFINTLTQPAASNSSKLQCTFPRMHYLDELISIELVTFLQKKVSKLNKIVLRSLKTVHLEKKTVTKAWQSNSTSAH